VPLLLLLVLGSRPPLHFPPLQPLLAGLSIRLPSDDDDDAFGLFFVDAFGLFLFCRGVRVGKQSVLLSCPPPPPPSSPSGG